MSGNSIESNFHPTNAPLQNQANQTNESNFIACQNSLSEHSFAGVPASLYNLTKSVPDPLSPKNTDEELVKLPPNPLMEVARSPDTNIRVTLVSREAPCLSHLL